MRGRLSRMSLVVVAVASVFVSTAVGQSASPTGTVAAAASVRPLQASEKQGQNISSIVTTQTNTQAISMQPEQPMSLGEVARLARAKKNTQAKAVKIFDDENMPRAPISAGEKAPEFGAGTSTGGKVTILDFWATWCGPCRHALPGLKQLQAVYGGEQVEVVSISEDEDEGAWSAFVAQNQMNWTQRLDSNHQIMRQYGANSLPTYVLIGRDGKVLQQYVGDDPGEPIIERMGEDLKKSLEGKS